VRNGTVVIGAWRHGAEYIGTNDGIERTCRDWDRLRSGQSLDAWCRERIGAIERRRAAPEQATSDLALRAAHAAMADAGVVAADLDVIVLATVTSDQRIPPTASVLQKALGAKARYLQVDSACTGFVDALMVTDGLMNTMGYRTALVVGADKMTTLLDERRFRERTIFGDGAGAVVLTSDGPVGRGLLAYSTGSSGQDGAMVQVLGGGSRIQPSHESVDRGDHFLSLSKAIPPYGTAKMVRAVREVLERAEVSLADVDWIVPHQASWNIVRDTARELDVSFDKFILNFDRFGNTSAGSIPLTLD